MNIYTIVVSFSVGEYSENDECWVAHYTNREDAVKAFELKLRECSRDNCIVGADGKVPMDDNEEDGIRKTVDDLFDDMAGNGYCYNVYHGSYCDRIFIRCQELQTSFDAEKISWE